MRYIIYCLLSLILLSSCSSGKISTTETKPTETIIFGRLSIYKDNSIKPQDIWVHFNERNWGKTLARIDDKGYFMAKVPLGKNHIAMLAYSNKYANLPKSYISIDIEDPNTIYYVGDIYINWSPNHGEQRSNQGLLGTLVENSKDGKRIPASVKSSESTINYFKQMFPENTKEIETKLIIIE
ncbi:hypothetical protein [Dysgonomonas sp. HGC4]|uniref:hypothetical protein n=1 Tax=Dysgonomonas sp. HGC4 TaxID=1658009 RepID=UPI000680CFF6|nr:hypothetical protein [Dysgonomonas sp. HGC4]MBD8346660.1 hypothetical protein [Dysgonomonas sp. HGC4]